MLDMDTALVQTPSEQPLMMPPSLLSIPIRLNPYRNKQSQLHPDTDKKQKDQLIKQQAVSTRRRFGEMHASFGLLPFLFFFFPTE